MLLLCIDRTGNVDIQDFDNRREQKEWAENADRSHYVNLVEIDNSYNFIGSSVIDGHACGADEPVVDFAPLTMLVADVRAARTLLTRAGHNALTSSVKSMDWGGLVGTLAIRLESAITDESMEAVGGVYNDLVAYAVRARNDGCLHWSHMIGEASGKVGDFIEENGGLV